MHIILGALGTIVTILWLLHRLAEMGIDLGGLNPWLWRRRRNWKQAYEADPAYSLTSPMEVTALLITAIAKANGDMSSEERREVLNAFQREFELSEKDAVDLLAASVHVLGNGESVRENVTAVIAPSLEDFSPELAESALRLLNSIAAVGSDPTDAQVHLISQASAALGEQRSTHKWH